MQTIKTVSLKDIDIKNSPFPRKNLWDDAVADYADAYTRKCKMPPLVAFSHTKGLFLADGHHRYAALEKIGAQDAQVEVHLGGFEQALRYALTANTTHGLRRTNADKIQCVKLARHQWPNSSNRQLADICGVSPSLVDTIMKKSKPQKVPLKGTPQGLTTSAPTVDQNEKPLDKKPGTEVAIPAELPKPNPKKAEQDPIIPIDKTGYHIPKGILETWKRAEEVKALVQQVTKLRQLLLDVAESRDRLWCGINFQDVDISLQNVITNLRNAMPDCVCPTCSGHPEVQPNGNCTMCHGKGFISEWYWKGPCVPAKTRQIRVNIVAHYKENNHEPTRLSAASV